MAEECTDDSVAISSSTPPNWWDLHHAASLSSWTNTSPWQQSNPSSNSTCEEDLSMSTSFTNASNHSGLTVESARQLVEPSSSSEMMGEHASDHSQLWNHILLGVGSNEELENSQDVGENLLDALSSKTTSTMSSGIFGPACDYFKKMDNNWELTNPTSFNNFEKQLNGFSESLIGSGRLNKLVSHLCIAPPNPEVKRQLFDPLTGNTSLNPSVNNHYSSQHQTYSNSTPCLVGESRNSGFQSCYSRDPKVDNEHRTRPTAPFRRPFNSNGVGYHIGLNNSVLVGDNSKYYYGMPDATSRSARNFADVLTFTNRLSKPLVDFQVPKPCFKSINLSDSRKQGIQTSSPIGKGHGTTNEGKKRREETSETAVKKAKHESSTVSTVKMQASKVKLSERVTALQQIVSPFGRTDTASVLYEAIQYIKFLQGQVQLLSNPSTKTTNSQNDPWVGLDRKADKGDAKLDLKSRGLCLVPVSSTPQIYHDNAGSDYWTPTYRGCLYR